MEYIAYAAVAVFAVTFTAIALTTLLKGSRACKIPVRLEGDADTVQKICAEFDLVRLSVDGSSATARIYVEPPDMEELFRVCVAKKVRAVAGMD